MKLFNAERLQEKPDAILFDLDNTLYAYDPAHEAGMTAVWLKLHQVCGVDSDKASRAFDEARQQVKNRLGHTAASHHRLLYMQRMLELMGLGSQVLLALDLEQTYWRYFLQKASLFQGVREALDEIRLLSIPVAIVTDLTSAIQFRKMIYFGLDQYFDCVVTSEEAGADKPHAAIFHLTIEKLRPAGNRIWMIGDSLEKDVRGSRQALDAVTLYKGREGEALAFKDDAPDASFSNFLELSRWCQRWKSA
jgi:HAD superfamily hydrolase (TIGR01549 family)